MKENGGGLQSTQAPMDLLFLIFFHGPLQESATRLPLRSFESRALPRPAIVDRGMVQRNNDYIFAIMPLFQLNLQATRMYERFLSRSAQL